jgi:hypothetical protein
MESSLTPDKRGGLNGSLQHQLDVQFARQYFPIEKEAAEEPVMSELLSGPSTGKALAREFLAYSCAELSVPARLFAMQHIRGASKQGLTGKESTQHPLIARVVFL